MNITEGELTVLHAILTNDFTAFNGGLPGTPEQPYTFDDGDWQVWTDCIDCCLGAVASKLPKGKAFSATCSSLVRKGLIGVGKQGKDSCLWFTEEGYKVARERAPI